MRKLHIQVMSFRWLCWFWPIPGNMYICGRFNSIAKGLNAIEGHWVRNFARKGSLIARSAVMWRFQFN